MSSLTPMMQQYVNLKNEYKDCILFYRLGDFYEMFFEDAITASRDLEITLTGKSCGLEERAPMCGVPFHAVDNYLNRLIQKGYKVAICEQIEDPSQTKGLVKRDVVRIVTPGTNFNVQAIEGERNNYLMCIIFKNKKYGVSVCDITTGEFLVTELNDEKSLLDEIQKFSPSEIICNEQNFDSTFLNDHIIFPVESSYCEETRVNEILKTHFNVSTIESLGIDFLKEGVLSAGALLQYLYHTQKTSLHHIAHIKPYLSSSFMLLDSATRRNLELTETLREKQKKGSLLGVLDRTKTAMGARFLRQSIEQPLVVADEIELRHNAVEELINHSLEREEIREYLSPVYDLERLLGKISYKSATPRDLLAFLQSIEMIPHIKVVLDGFYSILLQNCNDSIDELSDLRTLIQESIQPEAPLSIRDGDIIKTGYSSEVDTLRAAKTEGKNWIAKLEASDRERTGIKGMKIKYNRVFGYYYEVSNAYSHLVPDDYVRKQTLANAERYTNQALKELEDTILGAEDKLYSLEQSLFISIREEIGAQIQRIQETAHGIATLDTFASLAYVAQKNNYVKPTLNTTGFLSIEEGRHPVVEQMIPNQGFIPNDTLLDQTGHHISIITGPNMAGKSTYMRQVALIVLMAQIGSYVPALKADISVTDRIFTRVGASDDLASGQSTFMVEMNEVANILKNATPKSLLILDEIGRGTSTYDGLSIAWAVVEYISQPHILGAKTLFATHYHELTQLEGRMDNVVNYCIAVEEHGDNIVFLRKIKRGGADKSYGIQVAKLAGVPDVVINRAKELLQQLTNAHAPVSIPEQTVPVQMSFLEDLTETSLKKELQALNINTLSPLEALNILQELQNKAMN